MKSELNPAQKNERNFFDYFLYIVAGSVFVTMSFSFLLWLQF